MQIKPSNQLSEFVKHYLFIESNTKGDKKFQLFSDGNTGIVFGFKNRLRTNMGNTDDVHVSPAAFLYGQISNFRNVFSSNDTELLIVVFHPHAISQLLGVPANTLIDEIVELRDLFGTDSVELTEKLYECPTAQDQVALIELFLIKAYVKNHFDVQPGIIAAVELIKQEQGMINLEQLIRLTGYSKRKIERKFLETIGMTAKSYSKIVKLTRYLKILRDEQDVRIMRASYEAGYYDYSHAFKDFKMVTGITPSQYAQKLNPLALNLLEYPNIQVIGSI